MQNCIHLLSNRHFDAASPSQPDRGGGSEDSLRHHAVHPRDDFWQLFPSAELVSRELMTATQLVGVAPDQRSRVTR